MKPSAISEILKKGKVNSILLANLSNENANFAYLSGLTEIGLSNAFLILSKNKKLLIVHKMEEKLAKKLSKVPIKIFKNKDELKKILNNELKVKRIGIDGSSLTLQDFGGLRKILKNKEFIDISKHILRLRAIKSKDELRKINNACKISSKVMKEIPKFVKVGDTEKEIAAEIEKRLKIYGGDNILAFPTIVASGKNSSYTHHITGGRKVKKGDILLLDFGCKYKGYCSDITKTFVVGKPSEEQIKIYNQCLNHQKDLLKLIKSGTKLKKIDAERKKRKIIHSIFHSLGLEVHDPLNKKDIEELKENMVITVEPGIYTNEFGVRIEDDVVITKKSYNKLTNVPDRLIII